MAERRYRPGLIASEDYCAGRVPQCWHKYFDNVKSDAPLGGGYLTQAINYSPDGVVFLGWLRSKGGRTRLVSVSITRHTYMSSRAIRVDVVTRAGLMSAATNRQELHGQESQPPSALGELFGLNGPGLVLGLRVFPGF